MIQELENIGGSGVPQMRSLLQLYGDSMRDSYQIILKLQKNEYETNIESVFIPSKSRNPERAGERRDFSGEEYKLLVQLRQQGLLRDDDFTSVYSSDRGDDSTISSVSTRSSRGIPFRPGVSVASSGIRPPRPTRFDPKLGTISIDSDDDSYQQGFSSSEDDSGMYVEYREPDSDDDTDYSGAGLYSIPASHRFPKRVF
jgi:hypothetical protein